MDTLNTKLVSILNGLSTLKALPEEYNIVYTLDNKTKIELSSVEEIEKDGETFILGELIKDSRWYMIHQKSGIYAKRWYREDCLAPLEAGEFEKENLVGNVAPPKQKKKSVAVRKRLYDDYLKSIIESFKPEEIAEKIKSFAKINEAYVINFGNYAFDISSLSELIMRTKKKGKTKAKIIGNGEKEQLAYLYVKDLLSVISQEHLPIFKELYKHKLCVTGGVCMNTLNLFKDELEFNRADYISFIDYVVSEGYTNMLYKCVPSDYYMKGNVTSNEANIKVIEQEKKGDIKRYEEGIEVYRNIAKSYIAEREEILKTKEDFIDTYLMEKVPKKIALKRVEEEIKKAESFMVAPYRKAELEKKLKSKSEEIQLIKKIIAYKKSGRNKVFLKTRIKDMLKINNDFNYYFDRVYKKLLL